MPVETIRDVLSRLELRVSALERLIGYDDPEIEPGSSKDRRINKKQLAGRWGKSQRTIDRMRRQPGFPPADVINGQLCWWLSTIQKFERSTQTGGRTHDPSRYLLRNIGGAEATMSLKKPGSTTGL
jgi:hypothetical protein